MKKLLTIVLLLTATLNLNAEEMWRVASHVIDGDTFITEQGEHIRLVGINTPELGKKGNKAQPFSEEAKRFTKQLIEGQKVKLVIGNHRTDRYKRILAQVYKQDGSWVQGALISSGLAHVYSFPDTRSQTRELQALENVARSDKNGIWNLPRWRVRTAVGSARDEDFGKFFITEGTVHHVAQVKKMIYLNFGEDWRRDFTVEIHKKDLEAFTSSGVDPKTDYIGKRLRVRGVYKPVNGVLVTATHPEQITILN